jgi:hypothetical protein
VFAELLKMLSTTCADNEIRFWTDYIDPKESSYYDDSE